MQKLLDWTLETIRKEESDFSWMEEYRYEWVPLVESAVSRIIEGQSVLLVTDEKHQWFADYAATRINLLENNRPLLPFYRLEALFPNLPSVVSIQEIDLLEDMLDISYPGGYFIWYIGSGGHPYTKLAYRSDDNFLWIMDEEVQNSFSLYGSGELRDIKLLQLFRLFSQTIDAALFGELELDL